MNLSDRFLTRVVESRLSGARYEQLGLVKEGTEEDRKGYKRKHKSKLFQKIELQKKNRWSV